MRSCCGSRWTTRWKLVLGVEHVASCFAFRTHFLRPSRSCLLIARADDERDHNCYSQVKMFALMQVRTFFVDLLVTSPLICVVHPRDRLGRPVEWTGGERSPKKMESRVARHCADLRLVKNRRAISAPHRPCRVRARKGACKRHASRL